MGLIITDRQILLQAIADERADGRKIVFTNGCFDILHPGHVEILNYASIFGSVVVGVNDDDSVRRLKGLGRPVNRCADRMLLLAGMASTTYITPFSEDTPEKLVELVRPDTLVKGADYRNQFIAGADFVRANGGKIVLYDLVEHQSTTNTINKIRGVK